MSNGWYCQWIKRVLVEVIVSLFIVFFMVDLFSMCVAASNIVVSISVILRPLDCRCFEKAWTSDL
jgi:hypothetical protein